jgi:hypothetical protein
MTDRRPFPPPWTAEETEACFIVRDHNGQALAYVYFEDEPGRRTAANLLTRDEARRIDIAQLPELLKRPRHRHGWPQRDSRMASRATRRGRRFGWPRLIFQITPAQLNG